MVYTKWLHETDMSELHIVGGKNASLGEMLQHLSCLGIKIPNGFVITTDVFDDFINVEIPDIDTNKLQQLKTISQNIQNKIKQAEFSSCIRDEILQKYNELSKMYNTQDVDVAVRSSGTSEDLPDASFAGQQDTYLNVNGIDNLLSKIKCCFASLYNVRAMSYRRNMNYDNQKVKLSVCIQKMVRSDLAVSGVAFTVDINSGFKDLVVINSSYGLGEMVVSGQVSPDEFLVYKNKLADFSPIIDRKMGNRDRKMVYDNQGGTQIVDLTTKETQNFSMTNAQVLKLAKWCVQIEDYYSNKKGSWCPMDIEWGIDGIDNQLYILQSRPETVYSRKKKLTLKEYKLTGQGQTKLTGVAIGDSISSGRVRYIADIHSITSENPFKDGDILVTEITDPDWEPVMKKASAIITDRGGRTCHAAIVARELGVTAVVGTLNATKVLHDGELLTVSCCEGDVGNIYEGIVDFTVTETDVDQLPKIKTKLMMNVASPDRAFHFSKIPNSGVGLAREEFIINNYIKVHPQALLNFQQLQPNVQQEILKFTRGYSDGVEYYVQKLSYGIARIATAFYPKDVIVRFSDFKSNEYANLLGGKDFEPHEENPMIGWRGASRYYSQNFKQAFGLECQAIKYVREVMGLDNVIVMIPFCRTLDECDQVLQVMQQYGLERGKNGLKVYLMCEIPSNVILAEEFCQKVDGFSIGSNDLTQLTLGLDRDSELVASVYDERNPAVKKMLRQVIQTCKQNATKIGICGQGPSDYPDFAAFLINEGIDTISLTPDSMIKNIKSISEIENSM